MDKTRRELYDALLAKERTQELLVNLEQKKQSAVVTADQYELLKSDYQQRMAASVAAITIIKRELKSRLRTRQEKLNVLTSELQQMRARHDAGECSMGIFQKSERRLLPELHELKRQIPFLQALVDAKSSIQVEGLKLPGAAGFPRWALIIAFSIAGVLIVATAGMAYRDWPFCQKTRRLPVPIM